MDINIKKLNQLITVAKTGNISRAAELLHMTQPALSRSIAAFEEQFGIRIFERGRSGASLTPLGALAVTEAEALVKKAHILDHNLRLYGQGEAGKMTFGMGPLIASMVLPKLSIHFLRNRPGLQLQAVVKTADALLNELKNDQIEMLFCAAEVVEASDELTVKPVGQIDLSMIVRIGHPLADWGPVTLAEVLEFPILCGAGLSAPFQIEGIFVCDNYHILREAVFQTDSVLISSPQFLIEEMQADQLKTLTVTDSPIPGHTSVCEVRRAGCSPSPATIAISDFVRQLFSDMKSL